MYITRPAGLINCLIDLGYAGMGNSMDPSSGMGGGEFGQMGDPTQYLTPNDLISQRSSPDFMPGGKNSLDFLTSLFLCLLIRSILLVD